MYVGVENVLSLLIVPIIVAGSTPNMSTPLYGGCFSHIERWKSTCMLMHKRYVNGARRWKEDGSWQDPRSTAHYTFTNTGP